MVEVPSDGFMRIYVNIVVLSPTFLIPESLLPAITEREARFFSELTFLADVHL